MNPEMENRFKNHPSKNEEVSEKHSRIRYSCRDLAEIVLEAVPPGREQAVALTKLEEVMFWANAGIARNS